MLEIRSWRRKPAINAKLEDANVRVATRILCGHYYPVNAVPDTFAAMLKNILRRNGHPSWWTCSVPRISYHIRPHRRINRRSAIFPGGVYETPASARLAEQSGIVKGVVRGFYMLHQLVAERRMFSENARVCVWWQSYRHL